MIDETSESNGSVAKTLTELTEQQQLQQAPRERRRVPPPFALVKGTAADPQKPWYICLHCSYVVSGPDKPFGHRANCGWFTLQQRLTAFQVNKFYLAWSHVDDVVRSLVLRFPASGLRLGDMIRGAEISVRYDKLTLLQALDRVSEMAGMRWTVDRELRVGLEYLPWMPPTQPTTEK